MRCIWGAMYRHVLIVLKTFSWFQFIFSLPFPHCASEATLTPSIPRCCDEGSNSHRPATPQSSYRRLREQAREEPPDKTKSKVVGFPARKRRQPLPGHGLQPLLAGGSPWAPGQQSGRGLVKQQFPGNYVTPSENLAVQKEMPFGRGWGRGVPGQRRGGRTDVPAWEIPPAQPKRPQMDVRWWSEVCKGTFLALKHIKTIHR